MVYKLFVVVLDYQRLERNAYRPRTSSRIMGTYIDALLRIRPYISNFICRSTGVRSSRLRLYPEEFFRIPIIIPPFDEQTAIIGAIKAETASLDAPIARTESEITLMKEYRTRLTADIVTGKLDVRKAATNMLDVSTDMQVLTDASGLDDDVLGEPEIEESDE